MDQMAAAALSPGMNNQRPSTDESAHYENILGRAMGFAGKHLPRDEALEIAHEVASEIVNMPAAGITSGLIYIAVTRRLRNFWRSRARRSAAEGAYQELRSGATPGWAQPGAEIETGELQTRVTEALAAMPPAMREVFLLIREKELSYKEVAAHLGVSTGTVHTQLSRALALLRDCVAQYYLGNPSAKSSKEAR
jgi:RNA polymerase sigma-70 factor (ECF subfamily)